MGYKGHKIAEWEKAIKHRPDIEFQEIYLKDGWVESVVGIVMIPTKRKVRGEIRKKPKRVRWNCFGSCNNVNGSFNHDLYNFNIHLV